MKQVSFHHALLLMASAAVPAAVAALVCLLDLKTPSVMLGGALILALSVIAFGLQCFAIRAERRDQVVAHRYLEQLGQMQPQRGAVFNVDALPSLRESSTWFQPLTQIRDFLASFHERQVEADAVRATLDVRLQRTTAKLDLTSAVLAKLGDPVFIVNAYDDVLLANPEAERRIGSADEKRPLDKRLSNEKLTSMIADVRRREVPAHRVDDLDWDEGDGQKRWYRAVVDNMRNTSCDVEEGAAMVLLRDVTDERDVRRRHAEFVSAASHEMKTPLAGIKAYVELLGDGDAQSEEERDEFLGVINGQADRLQRLIENLLNIARIEAGVVKVSKQSRSVNEILAETIDVVGPAAEAKQISLVTDLSPLYLGALVDRDMLSQAVINLMSNAVKYTKPGGRVTLRSRLGDHEITIEVEDTGVGLSEDDCRRVFEKFYRVEKDKSMAAGTGLGLALAQHIVEDVHGGKLTVRSKLGEGSTFSIVIPSAGRSG